VGVCELENRGDGTLERYKKKGVSWYFKKYVEWLVCLQFCCLLLVSTSSLVSVLPDADMTCALHAYS
jgi:hypothetical protein